MRRVPVVFAIALALSSCELSDVTVVDFEDVVVAEVYVSIDEAGSGDSYIRAFLHGNAPGRPASSVTFDDATVTVTADTLGPATLSLTTLDGCLENAPAGSTGSCFQVLPVYANDVRPGAAVELSVALADGRSLSGATTVPGDFSLEASANCRLPSDTPMDVVWTEADQAWAYLTETTIVGLDSALVSEGIDAPGELYLLGLAIGSQDTTVVFPDEFGVFDRFDLDRDLAVRLQDGLPEDVLAEIAISAIDRNFVNWVRGGSFNPSGQVRISSVTGDGIGVLASAVVRRVSVIASDSPSDGALCPGV